MKKLLLAACLSALCFSVQAADAPADAPKTKQVCKDSVGKDGKPIKNKDGTNKQTCRTVKIHKKYDATEVPTTPPKK
jgi:hypothetical protein